VAVAAVAAAVAASTQMELLVAVELEDLYSVILTATR
jgi:hypothetical protein